MAAKTITSTNAVMTLTATGLFPAPVRIQGFATDKAWAIAAIKRAEVMMGVDGKMSAGYTPVPVVETISLQADSVSKDFFAAIDEAMQTQREVISLQGTLVIPSTGESFVMVNGYLTGWQPTPDGQKLLQPQDAEITWETVHRAVL